MTEYKEDKISRVLDIYTRLMNGYVIRKSEEADRFGVYERSIQRDIDDICNYMDNDTSRSGYINEVLYDREKKGFRLKQIFIKNEKHYYVEHWHHKEFLDAMWDTGQAVKNSRYIEIKYQGIQGSTVKTRKLQPLAIMFSEYY